MRYQYDFVLIPEGAFIMGADREIEKDAELDETPSRQVWLSSYDVLRTPVTVGQWNDFIRDTGYEWRFQEENARVSPGDNYPITYVSWYECLKFAEWLSSVLHRQCSLPTEAQWEKVCRGCNGQLYPWGSGEWDMTDEICRATDVRLASIARLLGKKQASDVEYELLNLYPTNYPVGWRPEAQSPYGCLDVWMNVSEWCLDWFDYYDSQELTTLDPSGPSSGYGRVIRGGSVYGGGWPRCSHRRSSFAKPEERQWNLGFRVVAAGS